MDGCSFYRLCENFCGPYYPNPGGKILAHFWSQKLGFFASIFKILCCPLDFELLIFDTSKNIDFCRNFVFHNVFSYLGANMGPKMGEQLHFEYVLFQ